MSKNRTPAPPSRPPRSIGRPLGIIELERFTQESLSRWNAFSKDLDELQAALYFGVLPEQRRLRQALLDAVALTRSTTVHLDRWARIITFEYSLNPLSAAGSLRSYGGRFNVGVDLDEGTLNPWPALYVAEDYETAFREKYQMAPTDFSGGLNAQELALTHTTSHSTVFLNGSVSNVFDMTTPSTLTAVAQVLRKIRMPMRARELKKRLQVPPKDLWMIATGKQLYDAVLTYNWRTLPAQFGLPASGHTIAELARAAGFVAAVTLDPTDESCKRLAPTRSESARGATSARVEGCQLKLVQHRSFARPFIAAFSPPDR